jgi:outer membrane protein assembly factor BamB
MKLLHLGFPVLVLAVVAGCMVVPARIERDPAGPEKVVLTPNAAHVELAWFKPCDFHEGIRKVISEPVSLETVQSYVPYQVKHAGFLPQPSGHVRAYVMLASELHVLKAADGSTIWKIPLEDEEPVLLEREEILYVYVSSGGEGILRALNISDGALIWSEKRLPENGTLREENTRVYVFNRNTLVAMDSKNGQHLWKIEFPTRLEYVTRLLKPLERTICGLHLHKYAILVDMLDKRRGGRHVYSFDFHGGNLKWQRIGITKAVSDFAYIYAKRGGYLNVVDLESGNLERFYKLDRPDGEYVWVIPGLLVYSSSQRYFDTGATRVATPAVSEETEEGKNTPESGGEAEDDEGSIEYMKREILAVDILTKDVKWFFEFAEKRERASVIKFDDVIVVLREPARVGLRDWGYSEMEVFDMLDGKSLWKANLSMGAINVSAGGDTVYARTRDGWLYAFRWRKR